MKRILVCIVLIACLFFTYSSCRKPIIIGFNREFPDNIGTWWKYKVFDSIYYTLDTVTIRVIGHGRLDNGEMATVWAFSSLLNGPDTNYVTSKADGIRILAGKLPTAPVNKRYVFPLSVGSQWITQNILDTNRVTEKKTMNVIAGTFADAYRIQRNTKEYPGLFVVQEDEWFVPYIGMIYRNYSWYGTPGVFHKTSELVSYHIN